MHGSEPALREIVNLFQIDDPATGQVRHPHQVDDTLAIDPHRLTFEAEEQHGERVRDGVIHNNNKQTLHQFCDHP